jgi:hypothetical protein
VEKGLLSLAICKPMLRSTANVDDIVIGFAANSLHADNRLIYVARVNRKLENGDYYQPTKYNNRADCIYTWQRGRFAERADARYHGNPGDLVHDLGQHPNYSRANTLLSREFCYFGAAGSDEYKKAFPAVAKAVATLGRGHRVHHDAKLHGELVKLASRICALNGPRILGKPSMVAHRGVTHRGGGCGVVRKSC